MFNTCGMACIATWSFGAEAVLTASKEIEGESNCVDAVEKSINGEVKRVLIFSKTEHVQCFVSALNSRFYYTRGSHCCT